jgi:hypothetical protein
MQYNNELRVIVVALFSKKGYLYYWEIKLK